jgi:hypothetical protein
MVLKGPIAAIENRYKRYSEHGDLLPSKAPEKFSPLEQERTRAEDWVRAIFDDSAEAVENWATIKESSLCFKSSAAFKASALLADQASLSRPRVTKTWTFDPDTGRTRRTVGLSTPEGAEILCGPSAGDRLLAIGMASRKPDQSATEEDVAVHGWDFVHAVTARWSVVDEKAEAHHEILEEAAGQARVVLLRMANIREIRGLNRIENAKALAMVPGRAWRSVSESFKAEDSVPAMDFLARVFELATGDDGQLDLALLQAAHDATRIYKDKRASLNTSKTVIGWRNGQIAQQSLQALEAIADGKKA